MSSRRLRTTLWTHGQSARSSRGIDAKRSAPPELLNSVAKRLVDLFVVLVHTGEQIGAKTYKATRHLTHRRVQAQKKFARTTQNRLDHEKATNNTEHPSEKSLRPRRRPRPRGGKHKEFYEQLYRGGWKW